MHRANRAPSLIRAGCAAASHHLQGAAHAGGGAVGGCETTVLGSTIVSRASHFAAGVSSSTASASCGGAVAAFNRSAASIVRAPESSSSAARLGSRFLSTIVSNSVPRAAGGSGYSVLLSGSTSAVAAAARGPVVASGALLGDRPSRTYASMAEANPFKKVLTDLPKPGGGSYGKYYSLPKLNDKRIDKLPYSIRILLESAVRNCDNFSVSDKDVEKIIDWEKSSPQQVEIPFKPARVILQDCTRVPAVVDLAAMRDAMKSLNGDPQKINPLVPVDLVVDHSVQVDDKRNPMGMQRWAPMVKLVKETEYYMVANWTEVAPKLEELSLHEHDAAVPFVTHFPGCLPSCRVKQHMKKHFLDTCVEQMGRAFDFADNQVYKEFGFELRKLGDHLSPLDKQPSAEAAVEKEFTADEEVFKMMPRFTDWDARRLAWMQQNPINKPMGVGCKAPTAKTTASWESCLVHLGGVNANSELRMS
ncbi:unnamed protein product [Calypogeia fissa]